MASVPGAWRDLLSYRNRKDNLSHLPVILLYLNVGTSKALTFVAGERPFACEQCKFAFYKKSDLIKHSHGCRGIRFRCTKCQEIFHFQRQLDEHSTWSASCGSMSGGAIKMALPEESQAMADSVRRWHLSMDILDFWQNNVVLSSIYYFTE